jgi:hypothetical protein
MSKLSATKNFIINNPIIRLAGLTAISSLFPATAIAQTRNTNITFGGAGVDPTTRSIGDVISNALLIVFIAAGLAVLIYLIIGAFKWITSGGDKDAIGKARGTIVNALIGLAILALAFFITVLFGQILNINILNFGILPSLNDTPRRLNNTSP